MPRSRSADYRLASAPSAAAAGTTANGNGTNGVGVNGSSPGPAGHSPGRRRPPARVTTGMFSVNSSDLMGYGLSALDNSGLVVGDMDLDRRNEVEQGQSRRVNAGKRTRPDADTLSEQGDTDRYLKNMAADSERQNSLRARGIVPRQNSVVVTHNGTPAKDLRGLWLEVQMLQQSQQHLEGATEDHKRAQIEFETHMGCATAPPCCAFGRSHNMWRHSRLCQTTMPFH